jgi:hypothetical protein
LDWAKGENRKRLPQSRSEKAEVSSISHLLAPRSH